jgi:hypothetical protein
METIYTVDYDETLEKIGVISDTHIPARASFLPSAVLKEFRDVQLILHAGDLVTADVIRELAGIAPLEAVAGNMDPHGMHESLGRLKLIRIGPVSVGLLHGDQVGRRISFGKIIKRFGSVQPRAIVFGHLHEPLNRLENGTLFFNPGSPVDPRRGHGPSIGKLYINRGSVSGEIIYL